MPAPSDSLSYDEIHGALARERSSRSLGKLSHDFYERLAAYRAEAKAGLAEESQKGPSPRLVLLQGQYRNLEEMARDILMMRLRKVSEATFTVLEGGVLNDKGMPPEEIAFSKDLLGLLQRARAGAMREGHAESPRASVPVPAPEPPRPAAAPPRPPPRPEPMAAPAVEHRPEAQSAGPPVVVLRILDDIPPFEGEANRVYRLKREDIVTLPRDLALILVRRKKAVELEVPA